MSYLIKDQNGAPFPPCAHCLDQVAPPGDRRPDWAHVYQTDNGDRWYLYNCQRPTEGPYGVHQAEPSRG